jgi:hypothetical protein
MQPGERVCLFVLLAHGATFAHANGPAAAVKNSTHAFYAEQLLIKGLTTECTGPQSTKKQNAQVARTV